MGKENKKIERNAAQYYTWPVKLSIPTHQQCQKERIPYRRKSPKKTGKISMHIKQKLPHGQILCKPRPCL